MKQKLLLTLGLFLAGFASQAQTQSDLRMRNWFFGANAGISFATTPPTVVLSSAMSTYEAAASISDAQGKLLFYTDGVSIWNRKHQLMANASNIGGHPSASQGAVIVPDPANAQRYYVFLAPSVDIRTTVGGLRYVLVDMTAQGGLGEAGPTITVFAGRSAEKLTAVLHRNGRDTWIIVHDFPGNAFRAYLLSSSGVSATPTVSSVGALQSGGGGNYDTNNAGGYLRASPDGSKMAMAQLNSIFELFDFDNSSGTVSNPITLGDPDGKCYGLEFSPDGTRLYGSTTLYGSVYQWNLAAGSVSGILASARKIATVSDYATSLAKGPDGRIYVCIANRPYLSVIPNPNLLGTACGFVENGIYLEGKSTQSGLPNFPNGYALAPALATTAGQLLKQTAIYPNPAHDQLRLSLPAALSRPGLSLTLRNALGQQVVRRQLSGAGPGVQVPLPNLLQGIYTLQIQTSTGETVSRRITIE